MVSLLGVAPTTVIREIKDPALTEELHQMEIKDLLVRKQYKFGVLYASPTDLTENQMFSNRNFFFLLFQPNELNSEIWQFTVEGSPDWNEFLDFLGEKIELLGWELYAGGLDTKGIFYLFFFANFFYEFIKFFKRGNNRKIFYIYTTKRCSNYVPCFYFITL